mgnify:CR=1 FL=1|tara:strand:- start:297 stop:416 length:120 start_codon:yes stop_codon:yes gene_type:complete
MFESDHVGNIVYGNVIGSYIGALNRLNIKQGNGVFEYVK